MNKCPQCGCEFTGRFCPECGAKWEDEKTCPECGAKVKGGARFCNDCGYSFLKKPPEAAVASVATKRKDENREGKSGAKSAFINSAISKAYPFLKYATAAMSALFSALLFAFFAAPVAVIPAQEFMGERTPAESLGNLYSMYNGIFGEIPELVGAVTALIALAAISLAFACFAAVSFIAPPLKFKKITVANKFKLSFSGLLSYGAYAFYLVFFIIGCVICGKISAADGGAGALAAGACPVLIIVFSAVFAVLSAACAVGEFLIGKKMPELKEKCEAAQATAQAEWVKELERRREELAEKIKALPVPVAPEKVEKPGLYMKGVSCYKLRKIIIGFTISVLLGCMPLLIRMIECIVSTFSGQEAGFGEGWVYVPIAMILIGFILSAVIGSLMKPRRLTFKNAGRRGWLIALSVIADVASVYLINNVSRTRAYDYLAMTGNLDILVIVMFAFIGIMIALQIVALCLIGSFRRQLYVQNDGEKTTVMSEEQFAGQPQVYKAYREYESKLKIYKRQIKLYNKGIDYTKII